MTQWWRLVAFMKATNLFHGNRHRDCHQNGQQSGYMLHHHCVDCCPGSLRDDTEQVVDRWRCPVVSGEALVMLHRAMCSILRRCTVMAIDMACATEVHLFATAA